MIEVAVARAGQIAFGRAVRARECHRTEPRPPPDPDELLEPRWLARGHFDLDHSARRGQFASGPERPAACAGQIEPLEARGKLSDFRSVYPDGERRLAVVLE